MLAAWDTKLCKNGKERALDVPLEGFLEFLQERARAFTLASFGKTLEGAPKSSLHTMVGGQQQPSGKGKKDKKKDNKQAQKQVWGPCVFCSLTLHKSKNCKVAKEWTAQQRFDKIKTKAVCKKCFGLKHKTGECRSAVKCNVEGCSQPDSHCELLHLGTN